MTFTPNEDEAAAILANWGRLYNRRKKPTKKRKSVPSGFHIVPGENALHEYDEEQAQKDGPTFLTHEDDSYRPTRKRRKTK